MTDSSETFNLTLSLSLILSNTTVMDSPAMSFSPTIRLLLPGFIGPLPKTSHFLGDAMCLPEELSGETALPIMVRCMFPPNTRNPGTCFEHQPQTRPQHHLGRPFVLLTRKDLEKIMAALSGHLQRVKKRFALFLLGCDRDLYAKNESHMFHEGGSLSVSSLYMI